MRPDDGAVHFSTLRLMAKSPAHYAAAGQLEDTPAMRIGRLIHAMILGGDFVVWDGTRRGKEWVAFEAEHAGREIVTRSEADTAEAVAAAVRADEATVALLTGELERSIEWELAGRRCAGRLDVLGSNFITDLKTTTDAEPGHFARHAIRMGYHAQMAWYRDGVIAAGLPAPEHVYVVAVELAPPHVVTRLELTDAALELGRRTYRLWFERLLVCEQSNCWPGYAEGIVPLDAPGDDSWLDGDDEERITMTTNETTDVAAAIAALRQRQAELFTQAQQERADLLARLGMLCGLLGPITRAEVPEGILRRRERKAVAKLAAARKRKVARVEEAA